MESVDPSGFLNVERLLESSEPRPRVSPIWWVGGLCMAGLLATALMGGKTPQPRQFVEVLSAFVMVGMVTAIFAISIYSVRTLRAELQRVDRLGELIQLRRWPDASLELEQYLSQPSRTLQARAQALVYLAQVLARLQRFGDAMAVQTYLIDEKILDPAGSAAMRLARTMAMLHEDHLFDADRAISELRRGPAAQTAALALVEIYRDVKTGHPTEAIELFEGKLPSLRDELGHRVSDAYVLAARAYDLLGRQEEAGRAFRNATLLAPVGELFRRYPEVQKLSERYQPASAPPEAA
jgi:tetratricopeptide (TPR) repeat protein